MHRDGQNSANEVAKVLFCAPLLAFDLTYPLVRVVRMPQAFKGNRILYARMVRDSRKNEKLPIKLPWTPVLAINPINLPERFVLCARERVAIVFHAAHYTLARQPRT